MKNILRALCLLAVRLGAVTTDQAYPFVNLKTGAGLWHLPGIVVTPSNTVCGATLKDFAPQGWRSVAAVQLPTNGWALYTKALLAGSSLHRQNL